MTDLLQAYRDDGPLARAVGARAVPLPSLLLTVFAAGAVAVGLAADGSAIGAWSVLGISLFLVLGMLGGAGRPNPRVQWLVPPLLRAGEYGIVAVLTLRADPAALWLAYTLLAVVAFHQYDIVYRLRHQRKAPSELVTLLGGGWDGRTLIVSVAALSGALGPVLAIMATWCGVLFVSESMRSWVTLALDETRRSHVGTEVEEEVVV